MSAELQAWPREGEVWEPVLPWPSDECPQGFYIHRYSEALVGGRAGWTFAAYGAANAEVLFKTGPVSPERGRRAAWEWRFGDAQIDVDASSDYSACTGDIRSPGRYRSGQVTIERVGAETVWAHRHDGVLLRIEARDLRLGFRRLIDPVRRIEFRYIEHAGHEGPVVARARMSFFMTTAQILDRTKTMTRREVGTWTKLKPGDRLYAIEKGQGLRAGESHRVLALIEVVSVRVEQLADITTDDVAREGFPGKTPAEFIKIYKRGTRPERTT